MECRYSVAGLTRSLKPSCIFGMDFSLGRRVMTWVVHEIKPANPEDRRTGYFQNGSNSLHRCAASLLMPWSFRPLSPEQSKALGRGPKRQPQDVFRLLTSVGSAQALSPASLGSSPGFLTSLSCVPGKQVVSLYVQVSFYVKRVLVILQSCVRFEIYTKYLNV